MISIRPATPADVPLICAFIRELADYEHLAHEAEAGETDLAAALFGPHPKVFCDLAERDGQPIGFALWFYTFSTFKGRHGIYLEDLYVRPTHRGLGVGRALLTGLAQRCASEQLGRLEWAVLDWNAPSIAFYEALGARPMNDWTVYRLTGDALATLGAGREEPCSS
jgi:GNAT superfamily N-acetyltransferase